MYGLLWSSSAFRHYNFQRCELSCITQSHELSNWIYRQRSKQEHTPLIRIMNNISIINYFVWFHFRSALPATALQAMAEYTYAHQHPSIHSSGPRPMPDPSCVYLGGRFGRCDRGPRCRGESCTFAHSKEELRVWNKQLEEFKKDMQAGELKTYFPRPRDYRMSAVPVSFLYNYLLLNN